MSASVLFRWLMAGCFSLLASDAWADRRSIRIDGFGDTWVESAIGSATCAGTTAGSPLLLRYGYTLSGRNSASYLVDDYCQVAQPGTLTSTNFFYADEAGLTALFGSNPGNAIKGIRYAFLDRSRFDFDIPPTGFQWGIYIFPNGVNIVGLYGLVGITLTNTSFISIGPTRIWDGSINGYNGEYFCFKNNAYIGKWNGALSDPSSSCLNIMLDTIYAGGFQ